MWTASIYAQSSFDVNELVAALGVVRAGIDPMTSQPLKILDPITSNAVWRCVCLFLRTLYFYIPSHFRFATICISYFHL